MSPEHGRCSPRTKSGQGSVGGVRKWDVPNRWDSDGDRGRREGDSGIDPGEGVGVVGME